MSKKQLVDLNIEYTREHAGIRVSLQHKLSTLIKLTIS